MKKIYITIILAVLLISVTIGCTYKSKLIIPEKTYINTETTTQPHTNMSTISLSTYNEKITSPSVSTKSIETSTEEPTKESTKNPTQKPQPTTANKPAQKPQPTKTPSPKPTPTIQKPAQKPTPTTQTPVQKPTPTVPKPTTPAVTTKYATVIADGVSYKRPVGSTIKYVVELKAGRLFEDIQARITYPSTKLELVRKVSDPNNWIEEGEIFCPNLDGVILNANNAGIVKFNASKVSGYSFNGKVLIELEFIVKNESTSTIDLTIEEMTIKGGYDSYFTDSKPDITNDITITEKIK